MKTTIAYILILLSILLSKAQFVGKIPLSPNHYLIVANSALVLPLLMQTFLFMGLKYLPDENGLKKLGKIIFILLSIGYLFAAFLFFMDHEYTYVKMFFFQFLIAVLFYMYCVPLTPNIKKATGLLLRILFIILFIYVLIYFYIDTMGNGHLSNFEIRFLIILSVILLIFWGFAQKLNPIDLKLYLSPLFILMKNKWIKIVLKITAVSLILVLIIMVIPENSFLFKRTPIENQQQLGTEILTAFKSNYTTSDTVYIATRRDFVMECGTGFEMDFLDKIKYNIIYKYKALIHRNIIYTDNVFPLSQKRSDKIVVTEIITYTNEPMPNDSDIIPVGNEQSLTHLKSSGKKIFLVHFISVNRDKVKVALTDYKKNLTAFQFTLVYENEKWKLFDE